MQPTLYELINGSIGEETDVIGDVDQFIENIENGLASKEWDERLRYRVAWLSRAISIFFG